MPAVRGLHFAARGAAALPRHRTVKAHTGGIACSTVDLDEGAVRLVQVAILRWNEDRASTTGPAPLSAAERAAFKVAPPRPKGARDHAAEALNRARGRLSAAKDGSSVKLLDSTPQRSEHVMVYSEASGVANEMISTNKLVEALGSRFKVVGNADIIAENTGARRGPRRGREPRRATDLQKCSLGIDE